MPKGKLKKSKIKNVKGGIKIKKVSHLSILAVVFGILAAGSVWADAVNVRTGTIYATIQQAIDEAISGDTINVAAGTYYEKLVMKDGVTVEGSGPGLSIIDGTGIVLSGNRHGTVNFDGFDGDNAIRGFSIRHKGAVYTPGFPGSQVNHGIHIQGGIGNFIIENNDISAVRGKGILISGGFQNVLIKNNVVAHDKHPAPGITVGYFEGIDFSYKANIDIINNSMAGVVKE